jgi:hypothetical protein
VHWFLTAIKGGNHATQLSIPETSDRWAVIACAAALIPATALAATASPATAARASATAKSDPSISVNTATLVANGAAVQVVVTVTCGAGDDGSVASTITQAVGLRVAQGESSLYFTCTGKPQRESGLAAANVNGAPFRLGTAVVQASLTDCPGANCTGASTDKVLSIGQ